MALNLAYSRKRHQSSLGELSDREVLLEIQKDDELALDELIRRKTGPLVQVAYRVLSDMEESRDVVQIAFVRIWEKRSSYDPKWSPNTWIYRIVTNLAIDHLRSQRSRDRIAEPFRLHLEHVAAGAPSTARRSGEREIDGIFGELVEVLTEKQRAIFVLRELEGLSSAEVSEIVGCKESTVRNHLFNARKLLRAALVERYPEYSPQSGELR
ncbi:MAG: RNA polymerase sigma factor [Acidobacteriota bacterium]